MDHLAVDGFLQGGLNISKQKISRLRVLFGKTGVEVRENVQLGGQRFALVHVMRVDAGPEESLALDAFQTLKVNPAGGDEIVVLLPKVVPDDRHDVSLGEVAGG